MRWLTIMVLISSLAVLGINISDAAKSAVISEPQMQVPDDADFSKFQHDSSYHAQLPCLLCHRRENNSPRPAMPGKTKHLPCAGCHVKQFADSNSPICTICHTSAQSG